jgi:hypothetical protein
MELTLEKMLDVHIRCVCLVASSVEPGGDVAPLLGAWRDGKLVATVNVEIPENRAHRPYAHAAAMQFLEERQADAYTMALTMWTVELTRDEFGAHMRSGKSVGERDDRVEAIVCIAGDKKQTLSADLLIVRSPSGRISHLRRREDLPSGSEKTGLFHDLLLQRRSPRQWTA